MRSSLYKVYNNQRSNSTKQKYNDKHKLYSNQFNKGKPIDLKTEPVEGIVMPKLSGHAGQNIRTIHLRWIVR
jgi:hypothetical protein